MDLLLSSDHATRRSPGTYGRLERGLLDNPSPEYLRGIARILKFSSQEWLNLYSYVRGEEPPFRLYPDAAIAVSGVQSDEHCVTIEYWADFTGNVLNFNPEFVSLFADRRVPVNIYHYTLFDGHARGELFPDWGQTWGPLTVATVRAALARNPHNSLLKSLKKRAGADGRTGSLLASIRAGVAAGTCDERQLCHPELGNGWVQVSEPLSSPGVYVSRHTWVFRTHQQPPTEPTLLSVGSRDPAGFFAAAERPPRSARLLRLPVNGVAGQRRDQRP
ncbi:hypothetical protein [Streptomyces noursei]|uniref:MmyB family transcriptional regulator n=1 Tax=Streptomyces noursei TaxID=1971 RepID=UPI0023B853C7|nr:hypothetical protein [Streptomyces noursei]